MNGYSKLITYSLAGLVIVAAVFLLAVKPALNNVSAQIDQQAATRSQVLVLDQQILAYRTAQSDLSKAENSELLDNFVVDDKNLFITIQEVERAAQTTNTTYQFDIHRDSLTENTGTQSGRARGSVETRVNITKQSMLEEVPYTLTVSNPSYAQLVQFFQYMENIPHFTELSDFIISVQNDPDSNLSGVTAVADGVFLVERDQDEN